jgi:hypothetical protein
MLSQLASAGVTWRRSLAAKMEIPVQIARQIVGGRRSRWIFQIADGIPLYIPHLLRAATQRYIAAERRCLYESYAWEERMLRFAD